MNPAQKNIPWLPLALIAIFLFSAALRFWGLGRFNILVFDEVYYAVFANNYLTGTDFFNAHPPLSQYIIALGIWIGAHLPFGQEISNTLTGSSRTTFSYRWINALTGSFIPLIVGGIALQLSHRRSYAVLSALFVALDGLFLVESRYALNNIYLVGFGLLAQLFVLLALNRDPPFRKPYLTLAGICFGASAAIKWNGLGFLLGIYLLWLLAWIVRGLGSLRTHSPPPHPPSPLQNLSQINLIQAGIYFALIPFLTYSLSWIPHLILNPEPGFFQMQWEILTFHQRVGSGEEVHPYCSRWYSWLLMWRPVAYFYHTAEEKTDAIISSPTLPTPNTNYIYDVHAMGNPILWWLSTAAIVLIGIFVVLQLWEKRFGFRPLTPATWLGLYFVINHAANFLPWAKVSRCTFLYHYMSALVFAELALAWIVHHWLRKASLLYRQAGIVVTMLIIFAFIFWLPLYLGLPLTPDSYRLRMWFDHWI
jgi:dolichyl-phosphate-mannose-protein mannosyltransferase